jgi:hypothetical protein
MVKEIVRLVKLSAKPRNMTRSYLLGSTVLTTRVGHEMVPATAGRVSLWRLPLVPDRAREDTATAGRVSLRRLRISAA